MIDGAENAEPPVPIPATAVDPHALPVATIVGELKDEPKAEDTPNAEIVANKKEVPEAISLVLPEGTEPQVGQITQLALMVSLNKGRAFLDPKKAKEMVDPSQGEFATLAQFVQAALDPTYLEKHNIVIGGQGFIKSNGRERGRLYVSNNITEDSAVLAGAGESIHDVSAITRITGCKDGFFICDVQGKNTPVHISVQSVITEQMVIMYEQIKDVTPDEKNLTQLQLDLFKAAAEAVQGNSTAAIAFSKDNKDSLVELGKTNGFISAESLLKYIDLRKHTLRNYSNDGTPAGIKKAQDSADSYNKQVEEEMKEVLGRLRNRTLATPQDVADVVNHFIPEDIDQALSDIADEIQQITGQKTQHGIVGLTREGRDQLDEKDAKRLAELEDFQKMIQQMKTTMNNGTLVSEFFQGVQLGEHGEKEIQALQDAFATGKTQGLVEVLADTKFLTDEQKVAAKSFLERNGGTFTIGGLLLALLMMKKASENGRGGGPQGG